VTISGLVTSSDLNVSFDQGSNGHAWKQESASALTMAKLDKKSLGYTSHRFFNDWRFQIGKTKFLSSWCTFD
jgi:hypothetical protein